MKRTKHTPGQIVEKLRKVEALIAGGQTAGEAVKSIEVTEQTYYRWKKQYGGMDKHDVRRLKELERENVQLKKLLADQVLDNSILKEAIEGKY
ncbi:MAG: putative transposase [Thalassolituus oleivorans]|jgi:putative transposase